VRRGLLGARRLQADLRTFDLALLSAWRPQLRLDGVVTGQVNATGRFASDLRFAADLHHQGLAGDDSWFVGSGTLARGASGASLELELEARPFALGELARRYPALAGLEGNATGHVTLSGPVDRLEYVAALETTGAPCGPVASRWVVPGRIHGTATLSAFSMHALSASLPRRSSTGTASFDVTGTGLGSLRGGVRVLLDSPASCVSACSAACWKPDWPTDCCWSTACTPPPWRAI
jgi:hypothetical protein